MCFSGQARTPQLPSEAAGSSGQLQALAPVDKHVVYLTLPMSVLFFMHLPSFGWP